MRLVAAVYFAQSKENSPFPVVQMDFKIGQSAEENCLKWNL